VSVPDDSPGADDGDWPRTRGPRPRLLKIAHVCG
jgi:hypothetical protein